MNRREQILSTHQEVAALSIGKPHKLARTRGVKPTPFNS
jgi:hypothetical protein